MNKKFLVLTVAQSLLIYTSSEKKLVLVGSSSGSKEPTIIEDSNKRPSLDGNQGSALKGPINAPSSGGSSGSSGASQKPDGNQGSALQGPVNAPSSGGGSGSSGSSLLPISSGGQGSSQQKPIVVGGTEKPLPVHTTGGSSSNDDDEEDNQVEACSAKILTKRVLDIGLQTQDLVALQKNSQYTNFIQTLTVKEYLELSECFSNRASGDFPQSISLKAYPAMSMFPKIASTVIFTYDDKDEQEAKSCSYNCPCVGKSPTGPVFAAYTSYSDRVGGSQTKFVCATTSQIEQSNQETVTDASAGGTAGGVVGGVVGAGILAGLIGKLLQKELENYKQNRSGWAKFWRAISFGKIPEIAKVNILGIINSEKSLQSLSDHEKALLVKAVNDFLTGFYKDTAKAGTMPSRSAAHIVVYEMAQAYQKINEASQGNAGDAAREEAVKEFEKSIVTLAKDYFDRDKQSKGDPLKFKAKVLKFLGDIQPYIFKNAAGVGDIKRLINKNVQTILEEKYEDGKYNFDKLSKSDMELLFDNFENIPRAAQESLAYQQAIRDPVPVVKPYLGNATPQPKPGVNYRADLTGKTYTTKSGVTKNHEDAFNATPKNDHYIATDKNSFGRLYGDTGALDLYARIDPVEGYFR